MKSISITLLIAILLSLPILSISEEALAMESYSRVSLKLDDLLIDHNLTYDNMNIEMNGNITVLENTTLILSNCNITFINTMEEVKGIFVEKNGSIKISNGSRIGTNLENMDFFTFRSYGNVYLDRCWIENVYGGIGSEIDNWGGLEVHNAHLTMNNSTITGGRSNGLFLNKSNADISSSNFLLCGDDALESINATIFLRNTVFNGNNYGIYGIDTHLFISDSKLSGTGFNQSFGIKIFRGSLGANGLEIHDFGKYGMALDMAQVQIDNTWIEENGKMNNASKGIYQDKCVSVIRNVTVIGHGHTGIYAKFSDVNIEYCQVFKNMYIPGGRGVKFLNSSVLIKNTNIDNCSNYGILGLNSTVRLLDNQIRNIKGGSTDIGISLDNCKGEIGGNNLSNYEEIGMLFYKSELSVYKNIVNGVQYEWTANDVKIGIYNQDSAIFIEDNIISNNIFNIRGTNSDLNVINNSLLNCVRGLFLEEGSKGRVDNLNVRSCEFSGVSVYDSDYKVSNVNSPNINVRGCGPEIRDSIFNEITCFNEADPKIIQCSFSKLSVNTNCDISIHQPINWDFEVDITRFSCVMVTSSMSGSVFYSNGSRAQNTFIYITSADGERKYSEITDENGFYGINNISVFSIDAYEYGSRTKTVEYFPYFLEAICGNGQWFAGYLKRSFLGKNMIQLKNTSLMESYDEILILERHPENDITIEKGEKVTFSLIPFGLSVGTADVKWCVDGYIIENYGSYIFDIDTLNLDIGIHMVSCKIFIKNGTFNEFWNITVIEKELEPYDLMDDIDEDNIQDVWEYFFFGSLRYGRSDDPDGDGYCNWEEYLMDQNPNIYDGNSDNNDGEKGPGGYIIPILISGGILNSLMILVIIIFFYNRRINGQVPMNREEE